MICKCVPWMVKAYGLLLPLGADLSPCHGILIKRKPCRIVWSWWVEFQLLVVESESASSICFGGTAWNTRYRSALNVSFVIAS
jgi:hypothetical protein